MTQQFAADNEDYNLVLFIAYGVEYAAKQLGIPQAEVCRQMKEKGLFVFICDNYEVLHTQSVDDLAEIIEESLMADGTLTFVTQDWVSDSVVERAAAEIYSIAEASPRSETFIADAVIQHYMKVGV